MRERKFLLSLTGRLTGWRSRAEVILDGRAQRTQASEDMVRVVDY